MATDPADRSPPPGTAAPPRPRPLTLKSLLARASAPDGAEPSPPEPAAAPAPPEDRAAEPPPAAAPPLAAPPLAAPPVAAPPLAAPRPVPLPGDEPPRSRPATVDLTAPRPSVSPIPTDAPRVGLPSPSSFQPREPRTWDETGVDPLLVEQIAIRYLLLNGAVAGRTVAADLALAPPLAKEVLEALKSQKLVQHRGATAMGDFVYELTDQGTARALEVRRQCSYVGPLPVPFEQYLASVREQRLSHRRPTPEGLHAAFAELVVPPSMLTALGPAITSGRAMFLHGEPGNGKTSLAERITRVFGDHIWIPQTLSIDGHLVKLYDPSCHEVEEPGFKPLTAAERIDRRWVRVKRPTVVAGGELTLEMLDVQFNPATSVSEAPLQLKANCGTLVIDDFGRQRIEPQVLLNRWIFPLERRLDFLRLPDGRKVSVPFEPLLVFSTNLEPRQLVDEAFLRRIPYKINVPDPTEAEFRLLVARSAQDFGVEMPAGSIDHLVTTHYRRAGRAMRFCHPRDLLLQIVNQALYERSAAVATPDAWDRAAATYFGML